MRVPTNGTVYMYVQHLSSIDTYLLVHDALDSRWCMLCTILSTDSFERPVSNAPKTAIQYIKVL